MSRKNTVHSRVRAALERSGGALEPAARSLQMSTNGLYERLCEAELRDVPARGDWPLCHAHNGVRFERRGRVVNVDVEIAPLISATWNMWPSSPEPSCWCEASREPGPNHGKVFIGFWTFDAAQTWLHAVGADDGWRIVADEAYEIVMWRGAWSLEVSTTITDAEVLLTTDVYFPRAELDGVVRRLSAHSAARSRLERVH